jgi:hypothetical protein
MLAIIAFAVLMAFLIGPIIIENCSYRRDVAARMRGEPIPPTPRDF